MLVQRECPRCIQIEDAMQLKRIFWPYYVDWKQDTHIAVPGWLYDLSLRDTKSGRLNNAQDVYIYAHHFIDTRHVGQYFKRCSECRRRIREAKFLNSGAMSIFNVLTSFFFFFFSFFFPFSPQRRLTLVAALSYVERDKLSRHGVRCVFGSVFIGRPKELSSFLF